MIDTGEGYRGYTSAADTIGDVTYGQPVVDATDGLTTDVVTPVEHIVPDDELDGNGIYTSHTGPGSEAPSEQGDGYKEPFDLSGAEVPEPGHSQGGDSEPPVSHTGFADSDPDDGDRPGNTDVTIGGRVEPGLHVYTAEGHQYLGEGTFDEVEAGGVHIGHIEASGAGPNETDDGDEDHDPESGLEQGYPMADERDTGPTVVIGSDADIGKINIDGDGVDVRYAGQPEDETGPYGDDTEAVLTQGPIGGLDSGGAEAEGTSRDTAADSDGDQTDLLDNGNPAEGKPEISGKSVDTDVENPDPTERLGEIGALTVKDIRACLIRDYESIEELQAHVDSAMSNCKEPEELTDESQDNISPDFDFSKTPDDDRFYKWDIAYTPQACDVFVASSQMLRLVLERTYNIRPDDPKEIFESKKNKIVEIVEHEKQHEKAAADAEVEKFVFRVRYIKGPGENEISVCPSSIYSLVGPKVAVISICAYPEHPSTEYPGFKGQVLHGDIPNLQRHGFKDVQAAGDYIAAYNARHPDEKPYLLPTSYKPTDPE